MAVRARRHDRQRPRHRADHRLHVGHADRLRPHQHRGAAHHPRLFAQRHGRHLRPHSRNLRRYKRLSMPDLLNSSVNSTLSRSIITHVTVTLALLALLLFGGHAIHSFTATMMFGVVLVGTYTSIFIAAPILIYLGVGTGRETAQRQTKADRGRGRAGGLRDRPHLPRRVPIDGYGKGGFRFGGMSHRGSLLCLPSGHLGLAGDAGRRHRRGVAGAGVCRGLRRSTCFSSASAATRWIMPDAAARPLPCAEDQCRGRRAPARRSAPTTSCSARAAAWPRA